MPPYWKKIILTGAICLIPVACTLGPDFERPVTPSNETALYINALGGDAQTPINRWWERINDPVLNQYVTQLLDSNLELEEGAQRIIQARTNITSANADYWPSLSANADASRSFAADTTSSTQNRQYTTALSAELETSWEIDLFGKLRRSSEAANASYQASIFDQQALTHTLIAELLQRRVAIAIDERLLALAHNTAKNYAQTLELTSRRYKIGASGINAGDIHTAQSNYNAALAGIQRYERALTSELYSLDILLGQTPGTTNPRNAAFPLLPAPMDVAICLPSNLLDRRPDLQASELRTKAANADIGIALANLYPSLNLGGTIGFSGDETRNFFSAEQLAGSILSSITARLFEGGALRANIALQEAETRELAAAYAGEVLNAMREVETALQAETAYTKEVAALASSVQAQRLAEQNARARYQSGLSDLNTLLGTQQTLYTAEEALLIKQDERWDARIALYLALGGDWLGDNENATACGYSSGYLESGKT